MTTEEFYAALEEKTRETGTVWEVRARPFTEQLLIRTVGVERHCPLSFVAGTAPGDAPYAKAALGLVDAVCWPIVTAADSQQAYQRQRLIEACGLKD